MIKVKQFCSITLLFYGVLFLTGCETMQVMEYENDGIRKYANYESGTYNEAAIPVKDYITKGIIFVESKVTIDVNGEKTGSEITNEMLMREAAKLDADDVINVKIDKIEAHKIVDSYDKDGDFVKRRYKQLNYIYKATGLAIKYTKVVEYPAQNVTTLSNNTEQQKQNIEKDMKNSKSKKIYLNKANEKAKEKVKNKTDEF
ncbi:hypothetical protein [Candidatus Ruminimicrobium bovinum]|uniref:hypothetical protein n=1 Tax=Candidatus Ruminimicrobium bovinum TaxID=3242779 RepID=UPI0039B85424